MCYIIQSRLLLAVIPNPTHPQTHFLLIFVTCCRPPIPPSPLQASFASPAVLISCRPSVHITRRRLHLAHAISPHLAHVSSHCVWVSFRSTQPQPPSTDLPAFASHALETHLLALTSHSTHRPAPSPGRVVSLGLFVFARIPVIMSPPRHASHVCMHVRTTRTSTPFAFPPTLLLLPPGLGFWFLVLP
ncbi:hypothetical protein EXIGLDRAFT_265949 [Exidia glandulosa HHB12029]|uniref:Uncharacterized protein n=1 Tax=Exidia glandulosa HHB12029 TaxID=1314781 RepID=A0A165M9T7_EXIGL|nr:hypothetical protein EXIGLDRAFT_265949 [Exidia glandulosa HHB12029]